MANSRTVRQIRRTLIPNMLTPIAPPASFTKCMVGNATGSPLTLSTTDSLADNEFRTIDPSFEREIRAEQLQGFPLREPAFWLHSVKGGTVILEWT